MGCAFSAGEDQIHYDGKGNFIFSQTQCPIRSVCPFNGFKDNRKSNGIFGCNPIYESNLSEQMIKVVRLLAYSTMDLSEIAEAIHLTDGRIRNIASEIYSTIGVENRLELIVFKNKEIG